MPVNAIAMPLSFPAAIDSSSLIDPPRLETRVRLAHVSSPFGRLGEGAKLESQKIAGPDPSTRGARVSIEPGVERSGTPGTNRTKRTSPRSGRQRNHVALSPAPRAESHFAFVILGLTPQALCCRALRALSW